MAKKKSKSRQKVKSFVFTAILAVVVIVIFAYLIINEGNIIPEKVQEVESTDILVTVNGEEITQEEFDNRYSALSEEEKSLLSEEDFLQRIIDGKLLLQETKNQGISVSEAEVEQQIAIIKAQFPNEDALQQNLEEQGFTLEDLETQVRNQLELNKLIEEQVLSKAEVSEQDIIDYYNENQDQFSAQEGQVHVAHILICYSGAERCQANYTKEEALDLVTSLKEQAKTNGFGELARKYSTGPSSINGGELGFFGRGTMVSEFEDVAFSLDVEEVSDPVETEFGYHLIKRLLDQLSLEDSRDAIEGLLARTKQAEALETYLEELRSNADIKIMDKTEESMEEELSGTTEATAETKNEFLLIGDEVCTQDGRPIIRFYTTSTCISCKEVQPAFENAVSLYDVVVYEWELDTGDNLFTETVEDAMPPEEFDVLSANNPQYGVPAYIFGCKYLRLGNAYAETDLASEEAVFREVLDELLI